MRTKRFYCQHQVHRYLQTSFLFKSIDMVKLKAFSSDAPHQLRFHHGSGRHAYTDDIKNKK